MASHKEELYKIMKEADSRDKSIEMVHRKYNVRMPLRLQGPQQRREQLRQEASDMGYTAHACDGKRIRRREIHRRARDISYYFTTDRETKWKGIQRQRKQYWRLKTKSTNDAEHHIPWRSKHPQFLHKRTCTRCTSLRCRRKATTH
eukprot:807473-Amphidinium_carterae.1